MLGRGNLVMLGFSQDAQLPQLFIEVIHIRLHPGLDGAKIVVLQLLAFGRVCPKQRAACINQILALKVHVPVH